MSTAVNTDHDPDAYGDGENSSIEHKETEGLSQSAIVWRKFIRHTGAIAGLSVFGLVALLVGDVLILVFGQAPGSVYRLLLEGTWGNAYGFGQVLYKATTLACTGLAFAAAARKSTARGA